MSMRWKEERYVRLYTRDTVSWKMMPWQSRVMLPLLMRKLDRAGLLDLGAHGLPGLAALIEIPFEIVERGIVGLLADGCLVQDGSIFCLRNFITAQEAVASDAQRKREQRARDAMNVTKRDVSSRNVTKCHAESHAVTNGHSEPSLADPDLSHSPARVISSAPQAPANGTSFISAIWAKHVGLMADSQGLCEVALLCQSAARTQTPPADSAAYADKAVAAFSAWVDGTKEARRPQKAPLVFVRNFARIQEVLAGKRLAVVPQDEPKREFSQARVAPPNAEETAEMLRRNKPTDPPNTPEEKARISEMLARLTEQLS